ncbi:MAG: DUF4129 domain-containing protein [Caldilineaceae bacterium]|nr:DUF4129 domain-containing protein [Caldilineaceae bacterium]
MIFTSRRIRLLFVALAGMEAVVLAPFLLLLFRVEWLWRGGEALSALPPLPLVLFVWLGLLGMIVSMDLLGRSRLSDRDYRLTIVVLVLLSGLLGIRFLFYRGAGLFNFGWLAETAEGVVNFHRGLRPGVFLIFFTGFLWLRASSASGRLITFFSVGVSFRLGVLLILLGGGILALRHPALAEGATLLVVLFVSLGLMAVSLARSDEKAEGAAGSVGASLPWDRLVQLLLAVVLTIALALALAAFFTPERIRLFLGFFDPLWNLLGQLFFLILLALTFVLEKVVQWLFAWLGPLLANVDLAETLGEAFSGLAPPPDIQESSLPQGGPANETLLLLMRMAFALLVLAVLVGIVYVLVVRRRSRPRPDESESAETDSLSFGGDALRRGWRRLRNLAGLVRRYGLGRELLDAISVENIYANLCRLGRQRGEARLPSEPPDDYLPRLASVFPGQAAGLAQITEAYMRVYYGEQAISGEELAGLRAVYERVRGAQKRDTDLHG